MCSDELILMNHQSCSGRAHKMRTGSTSKQNATTVHEWMQVFEYMESDLEAIIQDKTIVLSPADIKSYMQMLFQSLDFCHTRWVVHRDVKPNNFLISSTGNCPHILHRQLSSYPPQLILL